MFSMTSTAIGYWAIGGYVPQYEGVGQSMGEYAYRFLDQKETDISSINILPNRYKFDAKKLKEWGFENKKLPVNSMVINHICLLFGFAPDGVYMCPACYQTGGSLLHCLSTLTGVLSLIHI